MKKVIAAATAFASLGLLVAPAVSADPNDGCHDPSFPYFNVCTGTYNDGSVSAFPRGRHDGSGSHLPSYGSGG